MREQQLRTLDTLRHDKEQREAQRAQEDAWRQADPTRAPGPAWLGDEVEIVDNLVNAKPTVLPAPLPMARLMSSC